MTTSTFACRHFRSLALRDRIVVGLFLILSAFFFIGFFFPDPYTLSYGSIPVKILWVIRFLIPLAVVGLIVLYVSLRLGRIEKGALTLLLVVSCMSLYVGYTVADIFYQRWFEKNRNQFHPYLQLMPTEYRPRSSGVPNPIRIFCLGGSTTELPDSKGRDWPSRVEQIIQSQYGMRDVQVYNLGRSWYTSLHTLINYETNLRPYKPSAIVIMQSVNDLLHNADFSYFSRGPFRKDYGHFYGPVNRIIDRRSLAHYLKDIVGGLWYARPRQVVTTSSFPGLEAYIRNIRTIVELARHDSTRVILMTEPSLAKEHLSAEEQSAIGMLKVEAINDSLVWSSETVKNGMMQYNNALRLIAQNDSLQLIDLEGAVPKNLTYFKDEVHYQDTTFSIVSEFVASNLRVWLNSKRAR